MADRFDFARMLQMRPPIAWWRGVNVEDLLGLQKFATGSTYKEVGEALHICGQRASERLARTMGYVCIERHWNQFKYMPRSLHERRFIAAVGLAARLSDMQKGPPYHADL